MAQPVFYQTLNNLGVDPTAYYTFTASVTPETPAPPFTVGTRAFGSDGSEFVFVQASTSISLTDFVAINTGSWAAPFMANSLTTTNVASSIMYGIASSGLVLKQSVTFIPAGAFFWACTKGTYLPATTSNGLASNTSGVILFTSATAGVLTSVTGAGPALEGVICINSLTVSIAASIVPPAGGTQSNGFTVGPVVNLNKPTPVSIFSSTTGTVTTSPVFSF